MDSTLKSIYLRLDTNTSTLTESALGQVFVKIIYNSPYPISRDNIWNAYKQLFKRHVLSSDEVDGILSSLVEHGDIKYDNKQYYLSTNKRTKIQQTIEESNRRKNTIIETYFNKLYSSYEQIKVWLEDISIHFFTIFSDEWISDLVTHRKSISHSEESIKNLVTNRTKHIDIDKRDCTELPTRFFDFVNTHEPIVDAYLWEYGTSSFSAQLITHKNGLDKLTIDTFRNTCCILDTNILLFIALESRYKEGFIALESVFKDLSISARYLETTKQEYETKVYNQRKITLKNLLIYGHEMTLFPNDDFTKCAKELGCTQAEDFESFFDTQLQLPEYINKYIPIEQLKSDDALEGIIKQAENDDAKCTLLNNLYKQVTGRDKSQSALLHDVTLLSAVEYLRQTGKYIIVSEETSINQYSKQYPTSNNLPLAIRVNTLINILAINNGGETFDASDYVPLFANIIRYGLIPHKDIFRQEELYKMYEINEQIAQLPQEKTKNIVLNIHEQMLEGKSEKDLLRELNCLITQGKIQVVSELKETQEQLYLATKDKKRIQKNNTELKNSIRDKITRDEVKEYEQKTKNTKKLIYILVPIILFMIMLIITICVRKIKPDANIWNTLLWEFIPAILFELLSIFYTRCIYIRDRLKNQDAYILKIVEKEIEKLLSGTKDS